MQTTAKLFFEVEQSIPQRFEHIAALHASRTAIASGDWQPTYEELNAAANRLAAHLLSSTSVIGARIALLMRHDTPLIVSMLAVVKAARVIVVLNPADPPARLRQVLVDAEPAGIVTDSVNRNLAQEIADPSRPVSYFYDHVHGPDHFPETRIPSEAMAQLIYTSGSTGRPKGVIQTHRNILHNVLRHTRAMELRATDRIVLLASPGGGQGSATTWCALLNGATLCSFSTSERGVTALGEWLVTHQITVVVASISVLRNFFRTLRKGERFSSVRLVRLASEAASTSDVLACRLYFSSGCVVLNSYSSSETGNVTQYRLSPTNAISPGKFPIGTPAEGLEVSLWDEKGQEVREDEIGEIVVKSRYLSPGYWRNESLTTERFGEGTAPGNCRTFRSGDLASRASDGILTFHGRKDDQVKINGYRVLMSEVEEALAGQEGVAGAVVRPFETPQGDHYLVAYVVSKRGRDNSTESLRLALSTVLPGYMVPRHFEFLDQFPLTSHGKVDRQALPPPSLAKPDVSHADRPRELVEKRLARIWESVLGMSPIARNHDFFDLGGSSLQSVEVLLHIEEAFGISLPPSVLVEFNTIEKLAPLLVNNVVIPSPTPLIKLRAGSGGRPLFLIHGGQGDVTTYGPLARRLPSRPIFGLQSVGLQGESWPLMSIHSMARRYLQEVVSTEPNGPYFLGATCMGGMIALEMAQRLVRQGRAVAMLAFFDVPLRLPFSQHPRARERFYGRVRDPVRDAFRIFRWGMLRAAGRGCSQRQLSAYRRFVANMNSRANRRYQPVLYPGEITLFNTAEMKYPREDLRLRIRQYTSETRVISIPGKRSGLFVPPAVDELARHLRETLEMAESRCFNSTISKVSLHT